MSNRVESLEKKLAKLEAEAAATKKQLTAKKREQRARESEAKRKADTRRKVILGGFILAKIKQGDAQANDYLQQCINSLDAEKDKALFVDFNIEQDA